MMLLPPLGVLVHQSSADVTIPLCLLLRQFYRGEVFVLQMAREQSQKMIGIPPYVTEIQVTRMYKLISTKLCASGFTYICNFLVSVNWVSAPFLSTIHCSGIVKNECRIQVPNQMIGKKAIFLRVNDIF
jgi:hypothetical protein